MAEVEPRFSVQVTLDIKDTTGDEPKEFFNTFTLWSDCKYETVLAIQEALTEAQGKMQDLGKKKLAEMKKPRR